MNGALRNRIRTLAVAVTLAAGLLPAAAGAVLAQPGTSLGVVTLPGNGSCSVGGTFDGTYYITVNTNTCSGSVLGIYQPPPSGAGPATLVATKTVLNGVNPVNISAVDWDSSRNMLWGVYGAQNGDAWLIDLGDKTLSGNAPATHAFAYSVPDPFELVDGLAWDFTNDTLWISPDVNCDVWHFQPDGTPLGSTRPQNAAGDEDCVVSGVAIGSSNTLYIARNGTGEIRRVNKSSGVFVSSFATTNFRVEDLTCDATTYAPKEAVLAKDAFGSSYEAFEVEPGTCPQVPDEGPGPPFMLDLQPTAMTNDVGTQHCLTATVTDESGDPVPDITVVFNVEGASEADTNPPDEDGTATTDANGVAEFCYTGPDLPGTDTIHAFADTNNDGNQDAPPPAGEEPFDDATKAWVLPQSTPLCEAKITNGGWITASNGDKSSFGGVARADGEGDASGNEEYQDHGPANPMNLHGNVLVVVCDSPTKATIYGQATVDGAGTFFFRLVVEDNGEGGKGVDKYWIFVANGYDSGNQTLEGGNVQIHQG